MSTASMRDFVTACMNWAAASDNPSDREIMVGIARTWLSTAEAIERHTEGGRRLGDFRAKLN